MRRLLSNIREEIEQLEAQKEYREKSFQALMVTFQARTDENKLASEAYQKAIDERDTQIGVAKRAREDYDSFEEAIRLKEKKLRERAAEIETKRDESAAAFKALQQVTRERNLWFQAEKAHEHLKEAQAEKAKHRAVLDKLNKAHEKHEAMFRAAENAKQNMPEGKLDLKFFAGTAERLYSGLGTFVQTADVGR